MVKCTTKSAYFAHYGLCEFFSSFTVFTPGVYEEAKYYGIQSLIDTQDNKQIDKLNNALTRKEVIEIIAGTEWNK